MQIAIPLYEGFTALDAVGPYDVLCRMPGAEVVFCAPEPGEYRTENGMLAMRADRGFDEVTDPAVVVVPGGLGNRRWLERPNAYLDWLGSVHPGSEWTTSVCTGALMLAAAGLLADTDATTHWAARDALAGLGAKPVADRIVERGKVITAAGVSAGIDMALLLSERLHGPDAARAIQLAIEYYPEPPAGPGSADAVEPRLRDAVAGLMRTEDERVADRIDGG